MSLRTVHPTSQPDVSPTAIVRLSTLLPADSPRLTGENTDHIQALAAAGARLPPILVHRATMRVIDGMHRVHAAVLRGEETIEVTFFDGGDIDAFVLAVQTNIAHGLPLSLADRKAAAARIITTHARLSDRCIAAMTGLSGKTIGAIRRTTTHGIPQPTAKLGRDGKIRPINAAAGRRRAQQLIAGNPTASLREIARQAGVAPGTVRNVRQRIRHAESQPPAVRTETPFTNVAPTDPHSILRSLTADPGLRFTDTGRSLLRWLSTYLTPREQWTTMLDSVPPHCSARVADLARHYAQAWQELAEQLDKREQETA